MQDFEFGGGGGEGGEEEDGSRLIVACENTLTHA